METSNDQHARQPINPVSASLVRSIIARPLQELIAREASLRLRIEKAFPGSSLRSKTALFLNPEFQSGLAGARDAVIDILTESMVSVPGPRPAREGTVRLVRSEDGLVLLGVLAPGKIDYLMRMNETRSSPVLFVWPAILDVIIDINLKFREVPDYAGDMPGLIKMPKRLSQRQTADPRHHARLAILEYIAAAKKRCHVRDQRQGVDLFKTELSSQYVFASLEASVISELARIDRHNGDEFAHMAQRELETLAAEQPSQAEQDRLMPGGVTPPDPNLFYAIHQIWPDFAVHSCVHRSVRTVKADAAQNSFRAFGEGITWAVIDSGIDWRHPHFAMHANIDPLSPFHHDFTNTESPSPLSDEKGHGTHVAGIIAGQQNKETELPQPPAPPYHAQSRLHGIEHQIDPNGSPNSIRVSASCKPLTSIAGIAPRCKLISLKVLDRLGNGKASNVIAAISYIQQINGHGRDLKIHGVNLSLGHSFDAKWFACGHSPLCVEVNRLVKSGVVVVVAAGNTGYGVLKTVEGDRNCGLDLSINDPGNADLAITVGATHRDAPHRYGVSYFSSKGPTGDGRIKPDLIAPGERIISACAANSMIAREFPDREPFAYCESSGTSMAAPHVSGAIAAFLSIRNEFIGEAEKVKAIFISSATDIGRERYFQGAGLVDLLRAIQSV